MKMKKFDILTVDIAVEYIRPFWGRVLAFVCWLRLIRLGKFNVKQGSKTIYSCYRLVVPRFVKGGNLNEE